MSGTTSQIKVDYMTQKRYLLESVLTSPVPPHSMICNSISEVPPVFWKQMREASLVSLDFETKGNDFSHPDFMAVGVGLSNGEHSYYVNLAESDMAEKRAFLSSLARFPLIGHNVMFDGGVMYKETGGLHANWQFCTYGLTRQLSSESKLVRAGLKDLQLELLGWTETNEVDLDNWLVQNGYHNQANKPLKGEMYRAPVPILGKYCILDAYSTWLLFTRVLKPAMKRIPEKILTEYHQRDFLTEVEFLIEQQITGITIDKERLIKYGKELEVRISALEVCFRNHPEVAEGIAQSNARKLQDISDSEPGRYRSRPELGEEPSRTTKTGSPSKAWEKWQDKKAKIEGWECPENESLNWKKWKAKYEEAKVTDHFNLNSGQQISWLFYEHLKKPILVQTDSGLPAVDEDALQHMGEAAKILIDYKLAVKELGYVTAYAEACRLGADGYWRGHPQFKSPGTLTGRLSGAGGTNWQQLPKSVGFLSCIRPMDVTKVWVDCDWASLEPVVMTELTRDPGLMNIYGPKAKKNDIYLYFGSFIPGLGEEIKAQGYDPENPTREGLEAAKKNCKKIRNICKTVVLAKQYGAGAGKIHQTLQLSGLSITLEEVRKISETYEKVFSGIKSFGRHLEDEWRDYGGFVLNGIGRPITVSEDYLKDLGNRVVQSTGHDIHMKAIRVFAEEMRREKISFKWIICDFHDQFIVEVDIPNAQRTKDLISGKVLDILNKELGGLIPIKGDPQIVRSMAEVKIENFKEPE